jgi:two-component system, chemotaxis family, chemotaxis protein CheY
MKILIIDDSATMRKIVRGSLEAISSFEIEEAENCDDGLKKLIGGLAVNLVLVDWNMPGMTGIDFTKSVRANPALSKTPIIMITSNSEKEQVLSAVMAGVNDYMVKPFTPENFSQKIKKVLGM